MRFREGLTIRPYESADLDGIIEVFLRAIREVASKDYSPSQVAAWAQADRTLWSATYLDRQAWVAVIGQTLVGFADLEPCGHLDMMYVHPDYTGQKIATALLGQVEAAGLAQGLPRIFTEASITARPFFLSRGFEVSASQVVECRGEHFIRFGMEKILPWRPFAIKKAQRYVEKGRSQYLS